MALKGNWQNKENGKDFVDAEDINKIAESVIELETHQPYGIELIETITLTEDTSSIVREVMSDGTPYGFKSVFAMIGIRQVWSNKWVQSISHYDDAIWSASPYAYPGNNVIRQAGFRAIDANDKNMGLHIGTLEINGVILHLFSYSQNPGYHNVNPASVAGMIAYNTNNAKIIKFEIKTEVPLVAGTLVRLFGVRA